MLELGDAEEALHERAGEAVGPRLDAILAVGELAPALLRGAARGRLEPVALHAAADAGAAVEAALALVQPGDAVLVKGSRGIRLERVVDALVHRFGERGE